MDISRDHMRRTLGAIGREHDQAMKLQDEALDRAVNEDDLTADEKGDLVLGGLNRRKFLAIGGVTVASAAIFAACGSSPTKAQTTPTTSGSSGNSGTTPTTSGMAAGMAADVTILRTASSLEVLAVETYGKAIKSGLVHSSAVAAAAKDFMNQHAQHAAAFEAATAKAGGQPFKKPNPVLLAKVVAPALAKLKDQKGVVELAYALETAAAATYVSTIGHFMNKTYNAAAASIAGVESRHITVLASVLADPATYPAYPTSGFQSITSAVKPGTGV